MFVHSDVEVLLHVLALHESRGPFQPTLMHVDEASSQILLQPWFLGSHGDVAKDHETGSISDIVLAWCIANLESYAGITFDEGKLAIRFPRMGADYPITNTSDGPAWVHDPICDPSKGLWRLLGRKERIPNSSAAHGKRTNECVHVSARLRGYGSCRGTSAVPGHILEENGNYFVWKRDGLQSSDDNGLPSLAEAVLSEREAHLLGISVSAPEP